MADLVRTNYTQGGHGTVLYVTDVIARPAGPLPVQLHDLYVVTEELLL